MNDLVGLLDRVHGDLQFGLPQIVDHALDFGILVDNLFDLFAEISPGGLELARVQRKPPPRGEQ